jgi:hypothetical protein
LKVFLPQLQSALLDIGEFLQGEFIISAGLAILNLLKFLCTGA